MKYNFHIIFSFCFVFCFLTFKFANSLTNILKLFTPFASLYKLKWLNHLRFKLFSTYATYTGLWVPADSSTKSSSGRKSRRFFGWRGPRSGSLGPRAGMASYNGVLKDYGHSSLNEAFKSQNNINFKLIKTGEWHKNAFRFLSSQPICIWL